jgi:hypothetical protein
VVGQDNCSATVAAHRSRQAPIRHHHHIGHRSCEATFGELPTSVQPTVRSRQRDGPLAPTPHSNLAGRGRRRRPAPLPPRGHEPQAVGCGGARPLRTALLVPHPLWSARSIRTRSIVSRSNIGRLVGAELLAEAGGRLLDALCWSRDGRHLGPGRLPCPGGCRPGSAEPAGPPALSSHRSRQASRRVSGSARCGRSGSRGCPTRWRSQRRRRPRSARAAPSSPAASSSPAATVACHRPSRSE